MLLQYARQARVPNPVPQVADAQVASACVAVISRCSAQMVSSFLSLTGLTGYFWLGGVVMAAPWSLMREAFLYAELLQGIVHEVFVNCPIY